MTSEMTGGMKQKCQVIRTEIPASWFLHGDHRAHLLTLAAVFSSFSTVFLPPPLLSPLPLLLLLFLLFFLPILPHLLLLRWELM